MNINEHGRTFILEDLFICLGLLDLQMKDLNLQTYLTSFVKYWRGKVKVKLEYMLMFLLRKYT